MSEGMETTKQPDLEKVMAPNSCAKSACAAAFNGGLTRTCTDDSESLRRAHCDHPLAQQGRSRHRRVSPNRYFELLALYHNVCSGQVPTRATQKYQCRRSSLGDPTEPRPACLVHPYTPLLHVVICRGHDCHLYANRMHTNTHKHTHVQEQPGLLAVSGGKGHLDHIFPHLTHLPAPSNARCAGCQEFGPWCSSTAQMKPACASQNEKITHSPTPLPSFPEPSSRRV